MSTRPPRAVRSSSRGNKIPVARVLEILRLFPEGATVKMLTAKLNHDGHDTNTVEIALQLERMASDDLVHASPFGEGRSSNCVRSWHPGPHT